MDYKPYTIEWSRKRYLSEVIQQYFDSDVHVDVILEDIVSILEDKVSQYKSRADKFQEVLDGLRSYPH